MNRRERRRQAQKAFRDRRRNTLVTTTDAAIELGLSVALSSAKLRDEESRRHGIDPGPGGGAFLLLRRYELEALAGLLESEDLPVELLALRMHFEQAELFDFKIGGQG